MLKLVLDTSGIINNGDFIDKNINNYEMYITSVVAEELDHMKESDSSRRCYNARKALRLITKHEDKLNFVIGKEFSLNDDSIIDSAFMLGASILTTDRGMWIKCKAKDIPVVDVSHQDKETNYKGYIEVTTTDFDERLTTYAKTNRINVFDAEINEFVIVKDSSGKVNTIIQWDGVEYQHLSYSDIDNAVSGKVQPRNLQQKMLFNLMQNDKIKIILASGTYGSGKDFCMLTNCLDMVHKNIFDKIVWFRNSVNVKGIQETGFLPGSYEEKMQPYSAVLDDVLGDNLGTDMFLKRGQLEIGNLGAVRGRTFKDSILYLTEMQNCSVEVIQLLVSRLGEGSILVMNGDYKQIDNVKHGESSVKDTIEVLLGQEEFGHVRLEKVERSKVADLARLFDER